MNKTTKKQRKGIEGGAATAASPALRNFHQKITEGRFPSPAHIHPL
jgi:hypothetical protein